MVLFPGELEVRVNTRRLTMKFTTFLFPGQGSQYPGMFARLPDCSAVKDVFSEASDYLETDVTTLDNAEALKTNVAIQLCLYVAAVASFRLLQAEGINPQAVAGLSVGAFAAATACGTLPYRNGLSLVKRRAELMESRYPSGYGMSVVVGLSETKIAELLKQVQIEDSQIFLSNINLPQQITVSGANAGLSRLEELAYISGARKIERLDVKVPSHCPLYNEEAEKLYEVLGSINLANPDIPYISNIKARPLYDSGSIAYDLAHNIAHGVRWLDTVSVLLELGTELFVEMLPGTVLAKISRELAPEIRSISFENLTARSLRTFIEN